MHKMFLQIIKKMSYFRHHCKEIVKIWSRHINLINAMIYVLLFDETINKNMYFSVQVSFNF